MKKETGLFTAFLSSITFVSAVDLAGGLGYGMQQLIDIIQSFFWPVFLIFFGFDDGFMFEKILLLLILISIIYVVVSRIDIFKDRKPIVWIITLSVSLLAVRFFDEEMVRTIILSYTSMGVTLTAVIPLLIYFIFVQSFQDSSVVRKVLWIFFIVTFLGIWNSRYAELGELAWIYFFTAGVAFFFLLFDGSIRRIIVRNQMKELDIDNRERFAIQIRRQLGELEDDFRRGYVTEARYRKLQKKLRKQLDRIMKN